MGNCSTGSCGGAPAITQVCAVPGGPGDCAPSPQNPPVIYHPPGTYYPPGYFHPAPQKPPTATFPHMPDAAIPGGGMPTAPVYSSQPPAKRDTFGDQVKTLIQEAINHFGGDRKIVQCLNEVFSPSQCQNLELPNPNCVPDILQSSCGVSLYHSHQELYYEVVPVLVGGIWYVPFSGVREQVDTLLSTVPEPRCIRLENISAEFLVGPVPGFTRMKLRGVHYRRTPDGQNEPYLGVSSQTSIAANSLTDERCGCRPLHAFSAANQPFLLEIHGLAGVAIDRVRFDVSYFWPWPGIHNKCMGIPQSCGFLPALPTLNAVLPPAAAANPAVLP